MSILACHLTSAIRLNRLFMKPIRSFKEEPKTTQDSFVNELAPRFKLAMYPELGDEMRKVWRIEELSSSAKHSGELGRFPTRPIKELELLSRPIPLDLPINRWYTSCQYFRAHLLWIVAH